MDQGEITAALAGLPLGGLRFYESTASTNDVALAWAAEDAGDVSVVIADEQTAGRGRSGRKWHTPAGSALAVSVILRPTPVERTLPARLTGLAALALVESCKQMGLAAQIKWPNDLLLRGRKVAGILVESDWAGNALHATILGIGVNISQESVPPAEQLSFPATSLEAEAGHRVERTDFLRRILASLLEWRTRIGMAEFIQAWEDALAYRASEILIGREGEQPLRGTLLGLESDGSLRLLSDDMPTVVHFGEIHLRPGDDKMG